MDWLFMIFPMLYEQMMLSHDKVGLAEGVFFFSVPHCWSRTQNSHTGCVLNADEIVQGCSYVRRPVDGDCQALRSFIHIHPMSCKLLWFPGALRALATPCVSMSLAHPGARWTRQVRSRAVETSHTNPRADLWKTWCDSRTSVTEENEARIWQRSWGFGSKMRPQKSS